MRAPRINGRCAVCQSPDLSCACENPVEEEYILPPQGYVRNQQNTIDRLRAELAESKAALAKFQAANAGIIVENAFRRSDMRRQRDSAKKNALEEMARVFEEGEEYNAQTFYGSDKDDEVQLSFRVMAIIAHRIRQQAEKL